MIVVIQQMKISYFVDPYHALQVNSDAVIINAYHIHGFAMVIVIAAEETMSQLIFVVLVTIHVQVNFLNVIPVVA